MFRLIKPGDGAAADATRTRPINHTINHSRIFFPPIHQETMVLLRSGQLQPSHQPQQQPQQQRDYCYYYYGCFCSHPFAMSSVSFSRATSLVLLTICLWSSGCCDAFVLQQQSLVSGSSCGSGPGRMLLSLRSSSQPDAPSSSSSLNDSDLPEEESWLKKNLEKQDLASHLPETTSSSSSSLIASDLPLSLKDRVIRGPAEVLVYDTTLRDGTQGESVSASADDKLKITKRLSGFHMNYIEAGWPGSNPKDASFFERAKTELSLSEREKLVAFGSTRRKKILAQDDPQIQALLDSDAPTVCIVAKAHSWQVTDILRATLDENIAMIRDSVDYLTKNGRTVFVDLEHFFDGYAHDPAYALSCCQAATEAGAKCLVLCDTNGGSMPWNVQETTAAVLDHTNGRVTIGVHTHNDCGLAVANSLAAVHAGAGLVQGTINGIGERTGNADLCAVVPSLALHVQSRMSCKDKLRGLTTLSRFVDETLNRTPNSAAPFVGSSAFAHKGGLHVAAMERSPLSYQHIEPTLVGNEKRVLISELSGRQNILGKIQEVNGAVEDASERAVAILNRVKRLENQGYTFEGAEASVHLMILHATKGYCAPFKVLDYSVHVYDSKIDSASRVMAELGVDSSADAIISGASTGRGPNARATIKVRSVNLDENAYESIDTPLMYKDSLEVSDGSGPIDALAHALKNALLPSHPHVAGVELIDYKVRILDPESATNAATRVMIEFRDTESDDTWSTVSVDRNIISASVTALVDGFEYALIEHATACMLCDDAF